MDTLGEFLSVFWLHISVFLAIPAVVLYRGSTKLTRVGRLIFSISTPPAFIALVFFNISLFSEYLPALVDVSQEGRARGAASAGLLVATPIAIIFSFIWFKLLGYIFKKSEDEASGSAL